MASLSLPGKEAANSGGGEGKGNNLCEGPIVQITGLALKKKKSPFAQVASPQHRVTLKLRN